MPPDGFALLPLHPGSSARCCTSPTSPPSWTPGWSGTSAPGARPGIPRPPCAPSTAAVPPAMLKLSLALHHQLRRESLRKELHRGVEVHRLLRRGLARQWRAAHPDFDIVRDPAWLAADGPDGTPRGGLDVVVRHNPSGPRTTSACVALSRRAAAAHPRGGPVPGVPRAGTACPEKKKKEKKRHRATAGWPRSSPGSPDGPAARAEPSPSSGSCATSTTSYAPSCGWTPARASPWRPTSRTRSSCWTPTAGPAGGRYRDNQGLLLPRVPRAELDARLPGIGGDTATRSWPTPG